MNEILEGFSGTGLFFGSRMSDGNNRYRSNGCWEIEDLAEGIFSVHSDPTGAHPPISNSKEEVHSGDGGVLDAETVGKDVVLFALVGLRIGTNNNNHRGLFHEVLRGNGDGFL